MDERSRKKDESYVRKIALYGMLIALAMILSFVETLIPISLGIPGIKIGLANLVTIVCLYSMGTGGACAVTLVRIILTGFSFGNPFSMIYSLCGAAFSLSSMVAAKKTHLLSTAGVSILGGVMHNVGQITAAALIVRTPGIFWYLPVLMAAGIASGGLIGVLSGMIINRLKPLIREISGQNGKSSG
jgi:heptaprenyl diphosphate synthase